MSSRRAVVIGGITLGAVALVVFMAMTQLRPERGLVKLERSEVPFGLLRGDARVVREMPSSDEQLSPVFLVYQSALVPVQRPVPKDDGSAALAAALVRGPTDAEATRGLVTLITPDEEPAHVRIDGDVAIVELRAPISPGSPGDRHLAIAQLVYTLTARNDVRAVRFELDGRPAEVPTGDGTLRRSALTRADYPVQVLAVLP
jgi:hypothetical protein